MNNNDFIAFISLFFLQDSRADVGRQGGLPGSDDQFDNNDFIAFISAFFGGCP
ncbi:MAG: GC-type dockerin domain-anchored protein [Phycisphaerales bacterium]